MTFDHSPDPERRAAPPDTVPVAEIHGRRAPDRIGRSALLLAALAHAVVILWPLLDFLGPVGVAPQPQPIPIQIVFAAPPKPPPPPPPPQPKPEFRTRESGADTETTAPPVATETAPAAAPQTPEPPAPETPAPKPAPAPTAAPEPAPRTPPAPAAKPRQEPARAATKAKQEARVPRAPQPPKPELRDRAVGEEEHTGDPYLNHMWAMIERNRAPTTPIGPAGLHLEGTAVFQIMLDRSGAVRALRLVQSSGASQLDQEAQDMIDRARPFPALPEDYPNQIVVSITIHLFPE